MAASDVLRAQLRALGNSSAPCRRNAQQLPQPQPPVVVASLTAAAPVNEGVVVAVTTAPAAPAPAPEAAPRKRKVPKAKLRVQVKIPIRVDNKRQVDGRWKGDVKSADWAKGGVPRPYASSLDEKERWLTEAQQQRAAKRAELNINGSGRWMGPKSDSK